MRLILADRDSESARAKLELALEGPDSDSESTLERNLNSRDLEFTWWLRHNRGDADGDGIPNSCDDDDDDDGVVRSSCTSSLRLGVGCLILLLVQCCQWHSAGSKQFTAVILTDSQADDVDNCPGTSNERQFDTDEDGKGDACDAG